MLSHHHKTIFVHIPKCAGQSVEIAFLRDIGLSWQTRAPLLLRPNDCKDLGPPRLGHLIAVDYVQKRYIPKEMFDAYFKFAIVRDPWTRAVSLYHHLDLNLPFQVFVSDWLPGQFAQGDKAASYWFVRPQTEYLMQDAQLLVNDVIRFEALQDEFPRVMKCSNLGTALPHVNRSGELAAARQRSSKSRSKRFRLGIRSALTRNHRDRHEHCGAYYNAAAAQTIGDLYASDVSEFGYRFAN